MQLKCQEGRIKMTISKELLDIFFPVAAFGQMRGELLRLQRINRNQPRDRHSNPFFGGYYNQNGKNYSTIEINANKKRINLKKV